MALVARVIIASSDSLKVCSLYLNVFSKSKAYSFNLSSLLKEYNILDKRMIIYSLIFCFIYACSDEMHQLFINGRSGEIRDVLIDSIGAFIGISLYYLVRRRKNEQKKAIC